MKYEQIKQQPKISLSIRSAKGKSLRMYPSVRKMRKMLKTSLVSKINNGCEITLRVTYGKTLTAQNRIETFDNEIKTRNIEDLVWALDAFFGQ